MNIPNCKIPDFEYCEALQRAGLLPPLEPCNGFAYIYDVDSETAQPFAVNGSIDKKGTRFECYLFNVEVNGEVYFFAPTIGQLLEFLLDAGELPTKIPKKDRANFLAKKVLEVLKK